MLTYAAIDGDDELAMSLHILEFVLQAAVDKLTHRRLGLGFPLVRFCRRAAVHLAADKTTIRRTRNAGQRTADRGRLWT